MTLSDGLLIAGATVWIGVGVALIWAIARGRI